MFVTEGPIENGQRDRRATGYAPPGRGSRELNARCEWDDGFVEDTPVDAIDD